MSARVNRQTERKSVVWMGKQKREEGGGYFHSAASQFCSYSGGPRMGLRLTAEMKKLFDGSSQDRLG